MTKKVQEKKETKYHPATLKKIELLRELLVENPTREEIKQKLKLSHRNYYKLMDIYRELMNNPEEIERQVHEDIEKIRKVEKRAYTDLFTDKIGYKDYILVNKHNQETRARYGFAPSDKIEVNVSGELDITTKMKGIEVYLKSLEEKKKKGLL